MLLFVKKPFVHWLKEGSKRIEIRAGKRYANLRAGDILSMNGHFRMQITRIDRFASLSDMLAALPNHLNDLHYQTIDEAMTSIRTCYPHDIAPILFLHVNHVPPQISPPPQRSLAL